MNIVHTNDFNGVQSFQVLHYFFVFVSQIHFYGGYIY